MYYPFKNEHIKQIVTSPKKTCGWPNGTWNKMLIISSYQGNANKNYV